MENLQDILRLADKFKHFHNAEQMAVGTILSVHDALYIFVSPDMLLAAALIALSWFVIRLQYQRAFLWFMYLAFAMAMIYPIQVDNPNGQGKVRVSAALWYFSKLTTNLVKLAESGIDVGLGRKGTEVGNFAASTAALTVIAKNYTPQDTQFKKAYSEYLNQCTGVLADANNKQLAPKLLDTIYPDRGMLGRNWKANFGVGQRNTYPPKNTDLTELPADLQQALAKVAITNKPIEGYTIESYDGMKSYYGGNKENVLLLENPSPEKLGYYRKGESSGNTVDDQSVKFSYYPANCYEMFQMVDLGWRQVLRAAADHGNQSASLWGAPVEKLAAAGDLVLDKVDDLRGGQACVSSLPSITAMYNAYNHHSNEGESNRSAGLGATGNSVFTTIVKEFEEWGVSIAALFIPAAAALAMAGVFIIYPIVLGTSLIPGRESTVGSLMLTIIFVKLSVFFSYAIISAGGYITTGAICSIAYTREYVDGAATLTSSYRGIAAAGLVLTYLGGIGGGIWLAKVFTFNDRGSIAAMGLNRFGAKQLFQAAATVATVAGGAKTLGGVASGGARRVLGAQKTVSRLSAPPSSRPPTTHDNGRATHVDVRRRLDQMTIPGPDKK